MLSGFRSYLKTTTTSSSSSAPSSPFLVERRELGSSSSPLFMNIDIDVDDGGAYDHWRPSEPAVASPPPLACSSRVAVTPLKPSTDDDNASAAAVPPKRKIAVISDDQNTASASSMPSSSLEHIFGKPSASQHDLFVVDGDTSTIRLVSAPKRPPRPVSMPRSTTSSPVVVVDPLVFYLHRAQPLFVSPEAAHFPLPQPTSASSASQRPRSFEREEQRRQRVIAATLERMHQVTVSPSAAAASSSVLPTPPKRPHRGVNNSSTLPASSRASPPFQNLGTSSSSTSSQQVYVSAEQYTPLAKVTSSSRPQQRTTSLPSSFRTFEPENRPAAAPSVGPAFSSLRAAPGFASPTPQRKTTTRHSSGSEWDEAAARGARHNNDDEEEELSDFSDEEATPRTPTTTTTTAKEDTPSPAFEPLVRSPPHKTTTRPLSPFVPFAAATAASSSSPRKSPSKLSRTMLSPASAPTSSSSPSALRHSHRVLSPPTVARPVAPPPPPPPPAMARPVVPPPRPPPEPPTTTNNNKRSESEQRLAAKCQQQLDKGQLRELLASCDEWKRLNPLGARDAFLFAARAHLLRGEASQTEHNLKSYAQMTGGGDAELTGKLAKLQSYREFCLQELGKRTGNKTAAKFARKMCDISPHSPQLLVLRAATTLTCEGGGDFAGDVERAAELSADEVVRAGQQFARVLHRVGLTQEADQLLDEVCTRVPHAKQCQDLLGLFRAMESAKSDANDAYLQNRLDEAVAMNSRALLLDPNNDQYNAVLYSNRAACWMQLGQFEKAVDDCDLALKLSPAFLRARLRRARSLLKMNKFRECIADFELALRASPSSAVAGELAEARAAYKEYQEQRFSGQRQRSQQQQQPPPPPPSAAATPKVDLYEVLGVAPHASNADIKKAYHRAALKHHPDKNMGDDTASQRFKGVLDAFNTLKDPAQRKRYDLANHALGVPMM